MRTLTSADSLAISQSEKALASINRLEANPDFQEFMEKLKVRAGNLAAEILGATPRPPDDREGMRLFRLGIVDAMETLTLDRAAHELVLKSYGID